MGKLPLVFQNGPEGWEQLGWAGLWPGKGGLPPSLGLARLLGKRDVQKWGNKMGIPGLRCKYERCTALLHVL